MDVSMFQRVLIAGFIGGGTEDVDANLETVRLLRSQLSTKSSLRVIEAEVTAARRHREGTGQRRGEPAADAWRRCRRQQPTQWRSPNRRTDADPQREGSRTLPEHLFRRRVLEEEGRGISGSAHHHRAQYSSRRCRRPATCRSSVSTSTSSDAVASIQQRVYQERKGFTLQPKLIYIDGRTGATLYSETLREEILYNAQQNTPALSSVLRADGQAHSELPEHPQHAENSRHEDA